MCDGDGCNLSACVVYWSDNAPETPWKSCLDCQRSVYGGWPEERKDIPAKCLPTSLRKKMLAECAAQDTTHDHDNEWPNLPTEDESEEVLAHTTTPDVEDPLASVCSYSKNDFEYTKLDGAKLRPVQAMHSGTKGARTILERLEKSKTLTNKYVPGDGWSPSHDKVLHIYLGHFPPDELRILLEGNLYLGPNGMPQQVSLRALFKIPIKLGVLNYGADPKAFQELFMSSTAIVDCISVSAASDLHTNSTKKKDYLAYSDLFFEPSLQAVKEFIKSCPNLKTITVFGKAMGDAIVNREKALQLSRLEKMLKDLKR